MDPRGDGGARGRPRGQVRPLRRPPPVRFAAPTASYETWAARVVPFWGLVETQTTRASLFWVLVETWAARVVLFWGLVETWAAPVLPFRGPNETETALA